jgi:hypothetical protein
MTEFFYSTGLRAMTTTEVKRFMSQIAEVISNDGTARFKNVSN